MAVRFCEGYDNRNEIQLYNFSWISKGKCCLLIMKKKCNVGSGVVW